MGTQGISPVPHSVADVYIVHHFRMDVSSGLYYGFKMQNDKFSLRADSTVGRNVANTADSILSVGNRIVTENTGKGEFGFASLIHFNYRAATDFNMGLHIGAGLSLNDKVKARYFGGLSFIFGEDNARIALNVGYMGGNVETISDQYPKVSDGTYLRIPKTETTLITKTKFMSSPFVSVTYNLPFGSNKSKEKVGADKTPEKTPEKTETKTTTPARDAKANGLKKETTTTKTYYNN